jgi:hypothetical protein
MQTHKINTYIHNFNKKKYIKLGINQILILDALMKDGSNKKYLDKHNKPKYSEHFGMIDYNKSGFDKLIISGKTIRTDKNDDEILLPGDVPEAYEYEYMFHTHPPTPSAGSRASEGVLYEFPSVNDLYHFAEHFNKGKTVGSIIIAPEGFYLIKSFDVNKKINFPITNKVFNKLTKDLHDIQHKAITEYGTKFSLDTYYHKIIKDVKYLDMYNKCITKHWGKSIKIFYKPRIKDKHNDNDWIIPGLYLPIYF